MKKLTLRILSLLLVVCIAGAVFTACSEPETPASTEPVHID